MEHRTCVPDVVRRAGALVAVLALVTAGCGGAGDASEPSRSSSTTETTTAAAPDEAAADVPATEPHAAGKPPARQAPVTTAPAVQRNSSTPPASVPSGDPSKPKLPMTAELKESCVRPGGSQTITIRTEPESGVGYDTVYSDGKSGLMEGHYGGNSGGLVDEAGMYTDTWVVAANAPAGKVQVNVLGGKLDYQTAQATLYFDVVGATGTCS